MKSTPAIGKSWLFNSKSVENYKLSLIFLLILNVFVSATNTNEFESNSKSEEFKYNSGERDTVDLKRIQQLLDLTSDSADTLNLESIFQNDIKVKLKGKEESQPANKNDIKHNYSDLNGLKQESIQVRVKPSHPHTHADAPVSHSHIHNNVNPESFDFDHENHYTPSKTPPASSQNTEFITESDGLSNYDFRDKDRINFNYEQQKLKEQELLFKENTQTGWFHKRKLKIPEGSSLSLAVQVSRPNILPGLFFQGEGIILDAVVEVPIWFELDLFAKAVYEKPKPPPPPAPPPAPLPPPMGKPDPPPAPYRSHEEEPEEGRMLGYERCFLYTELEIIAARIMEVTQSVSHACLLRTICEIHSVLGFRPHYQNASIIFELIRLFLTPSFGVEDECYKPYITAERLGRKKSLCNNYVRRCPISLASVIMTNFVPFFSR